MRARMLLADDIHAWAREAGFHLVGLARAEPLDGAPLRRWLDRGQAASMRWMHERVEERLDPRRLVPGARTVVALGCCVRTRAHAAPSPLALYARGRDYHATLRDRLRALRRRVRAAGARDYAAVDTGPVLERVWAQRAGLGWLGKNGMLVTPAHGSHVVLATMILDAEVDRHDAPHPDRCGTCAACLPACPTGALVEPGVLDARRCLSFQTIEERGEYAEALRPHARLAFGCDLCQDACPWNARPHACDDARFLPRPVAGLSLLELARLSPERWAELAPGTALPRIGLPGLRRNALIALGAAGDPALLEAGALTDDPEPTIRDAARWALSRLARR